MLVPYVQTFESSTTWTVEHGFGAVPTARVYYAGSQRIPAADIVSEVHAPDLQSTTVTFTEAKVGTAQYHCEAVTLANQSVDSSGNLKVRTVMESSTYGRYCMESDAFEAPVGETSRWYRWPFAFDMIEGALMLDGTKAGDVIRFEAAPDTELNALVGGGNVLAAAVSVDDTQIQLIPPYLSAFADQGLIDSGFYEVTLEEGATSEGPYLVTSYDRTTGVVTLGTSKKWTGTIADEPAAWGGFDNDFTVDVKVKVTRVLIRDLVLDGQSESMVVGRAVRRGLPIPANTLFRMKYTNNGGGPRDVRLRFDSLTGLVE
jgi:hypothetical protein